MFSGKKNEVLFCTEGAFAYANTLRILYHVLEKIFILFCELSIADKFFSTKQRKFGENFIVVFYENFIKRL